MVENNDGVGETRGNHCDDTLGGLGAGQPRHGPRNGKGLSVFDGIKTFIEQNPNYIEVAAFALGFAESIILTSFFVPATGIFLVVGALLGATGTLIWPVVIAAALGAFIGDILTYVASNRYRDRVTAWKGFKDNPDWLPRAQAFVEKWGWLSIVIGKFVGPVRPIIPIVCGVSQMNWPMFVAASAVSAFVWASAFLLPAYYGLTVFKF
jgi:membrane protein DedA with SNARE-associated domain